MTSESNCSWKVHFEQHPRTILYLAKGLQMVLTVIIYLLPQNRSHLNIRLRINLLQFILYLLRLI